MFFQDLLHADGQRHNLEELCAAFSDFCQECDRCLVMAWGAFREAAARTEEEHPATVLVRHVIESLDGVATLVSKGGSHRCQPLLRSALEAVLGALYVLERDTQGRALAYQVAYVHKKLKLYDRLDQPPRPGRHCANS